MFNFIKSIFQKHPGEKIQKAITKKRGQAMLLQRNGKLREFASVMKEIEELEEQYIEVMSE